MATKSAPKQLAAKKTVSRKVSSKKTPTKKTSPARKRVSPKSLPQKSFHVEPSGTPFLTIAITRQTLYWVILSTAVLALGLWIIHLQNEINKIYDAIDVSIMESESAIISSTPKKPQ